MIPSGFILPYTACVTCLRYSNCPVHITGARGNIKVPHLDQCILEQLEPRSLAILADQLGNQLGILECEKEALGRKLEVVLDVMSKKDKQIING